MITIWQHFETELSLPESIVNQGELFMLKVNGDSMIDAAICDGYVVLICDQKGVENGEIVAALINGVAIVETFSMKAGHIWLLSANFSFALINGDDYEISCKMTDVPRIVQ